MKWTEAHTGKSDTFLTPPRVFGFRPYARRSSVNEVQPPLAWVDPALYETLTDRGQMTDERLSSSVVRSRHPVCASPRLERDACHCQHDVSAP